MESKQCFKCKKMKSLDCFYKHSEMKDGHIGKCKECNKKDVQENYRKNKEYYKGYEKIRNKQEKRKNDKFTYMRKYREKYPEKYKARNAVSNALRDNRLKKTKCAICGSGRVEAHHSDYSAPIDVIYLCIKHHKEIHFKER